MAQKRTTAEKQPESFVEVAEATPTYEQVIEQLTALQQAQLSMVETMRVMALEIIRLERCMAIGVNEKLLPDQWGKK